MHTVDLAPKHVFSLYWVDWLGADLHFRRHTTSFCRELGLPAQAMQHPIVVKACGGVTNVPSNALRLCKVKSCALDRSDSSSWDAVLCCGDVVIPANPREAA